MAAPTREVQLPARRCRHTWHVLAKMGGLLTNCLLMVLVCLTATEAVQYPSGAEMPEELINTIPHTEKRYFRLISDEDNLVIMGTPNAVFNMSLDDPITWTPSSYQPLPIELGSLRGLRSIMLMNRKLEMEINAMVDSQPPCTSHTIHEVRQAALCKAFVRHVIHSKTRTARLGTTMRPLTPSSYLPTTSELLMLRGLMEDEIQRKKQAMEMDKELTSKQAGTLNITSRAKQVAFCRATCPVCSSDTI